MVPFTASHRGSDASLVEYVLGTCVAMVLSSLQCQCEHFPHVRFVVVHEAVQVGHRVCWVHNVNEVVCAVPILWC